MLPQHPKGFHGNPLVSDGEMMGKPLLNAVQDLFGSVHLELAALREYEAEPKMKKQIRYSIQTLFALERFFLRHRSFSFYDSEVGQNA